MDCAFRLAACFRAAQPVAQRIGVGVDACFPGSSVRKVRRSVALFWGGYGPSYCTLGRLSCGTYPGTGARAFDFSTARGNSSERPTCTGPVNTRKLRHSS